MNKIKILTKRMLMVMLTIESRRVSKIWLIMMLIMILIMKMI